MSPQESDELRNLTPAPVLTLAEAAQSLGLSEDVLRQLAAAGRVPGRQIGEQWIFSTELIRYWLLSTSPFRALDQFSQEYFQLWAHKVMLPSLEGLVEKRFSAIADHVAFLKARLEEVAAKLAKAEEQLALLAAGNQGARLPESLSRILELAGKWKDHPTADSLLHEIYAARGRPISEEDER